MRFHATALRAEGGDVEEVKEILGVPGLRGVRLSPLEAAVLDFCRQVAVDANAVTEEQVAGLKALGPSDAELVEALEVLTFTTGHAKLADALALEADPWLDQPEWEPRTPGGGA
ncbi:MAG: hypothetical protein HYV61_02410 [Candidatus Rokubacteria bacterium]|nr:hypothetical protein [Candidatus Rokubacteria bacterium]